jgi:MYXO-CTERM domain-containing protein
VTHRIFAMMLGSAIVLIAFDAAAAPTVYTTRATFDTAFPGLSIETFQGLATNTGCPSPLSTATANNTCFDQGTLRAGFSVGGIDSHPTDGMGLGDGPTGRFIRTSYYADTTVLTLSPAQYAVGFDVLLADSGGVLGDATTATVTVYDESDAVIVSQDVANKTFFGIRSDVRVGSVRLFRVGVYAEGIDNLVFGPTFASIAPATGGFRGGSSVTLTGEGLAANTTVSFDGTAATSVMVTGGKMLTCVAPAHAAGAVDVSLTTSGVTLTRAASFTYVAHTATVALALTPKSPRYHDEPNAFTATVTGTDPTGNVALMEGSAELSQSALADGGAAFSVTLPAGTHSVFARYKGDPFHAEVDSAAVAVAVEMRPVPIVDAGIDSGTNVPIPPIDAGAPTTTNAEDDSGCSASPRTPFGAGGLLLAVVALLFARRRQGFVAK